jgi:predicted esterase
VIICFQLSVTNLQDFHKMVSASALFVVALGAFGALGSASPLASRATCYKGVYILAARGTGDPPNDPTNRKSTGQPGMVANMINASISDSAVVAVEYRATANFDYDASVVEGINDAKSKVQAYVDTCGSASRVVLLGWSQGGNVMTDLLAGGSKPNQPAVLAEKYRKNSKQNLDDAAELLLGIH